METWSVTEKPGVWVGPVVAGVSGRPLAYVIPSVNAADTVRILAAAPEMLAALKRMREVFEQLSDGDWRSLDATYVDQLIASDGLRGCDKVIAKAEGRDE